MINVRLDQNIDFVTLWSEAFNNVRGYLNNIEKQKNLIKDKSFVR